MNTQYNLLEEGGVYVIWNPCIVNPETKNPLIKIGRSSKEEPRERIEYMNKETPVPADFKVDTITKIPANRLVERVAHEYYEEERFNKEFFSVSPQNASSTVEAIADEVKKRSYVISDKFSPMTDEEKREMMDYGYLFNDRAATIYSDSFCLLNEENCPDGLDNQKWKNAIKNIKLEVYF